MGKAIYYCVQCSKRVSESEIESGKAFHDGDRAWCKSCAPEPVKIESSKRLAAYKAKPTGSTTRLKPDSATRTKKSMTGVGMKSVSAQLAAGPPPADGSRKRLILIGGGVALVAVIVIVLGAALGGKPTPPPVDKTPDPPPSAGQPVDPKEASARADLEKARAFGKAHADDLAGRLRELNEIPWKWGGTAAAAEATREINALKAEIKTKVEGWMAEVERKIREQVDKKEFRAAAREIEALKATHDLPEWRLAAEKRVSDLLEAALARERELEAEEAKKKPKPDDPSGKAASEEAKAYPARWSSAAAKATVRDYAGAIADLERVVAAIKDEDVKKEAQDDVEDLRRAAQVAKDSLDYLKQRPRGGGISVIYRDGSGATKRAAGSVVQIDDARVEIKSGKESVFVDWTDVSSATLADVAARGKHEPRILTLLCLLEGEREAAEALRAEIPPKWASYAEGARARLPKPDPAERNARELYGAAERLYRSMETRAQAVENYRVLKTDFSSTAVVKAYTERIARRAEAGKEYYFTASDFKVEGSFRRAKAAKGDPTPAGKLESSKDSDENRTLENFAEIEFAALPGQTYRCWLLVGGCCEETFFFYLQGTEVTDVDPKSRKKIPCEPGTGAASPVKHGIRNLKKTHAEHKIKGAKEHPKLAARWEWVEIPVPKYAAPGAKKLRFLTNQAGFSIGGAVVSASRKGAPAEADLKELDKARALDDPPPPLDPDLVGWWSMDDGGGQEAADLSGNNHPAKAIGTLQWTDGKVGGAVKLPGGMTALQVAEADDLKLTGDLAIAFWVRVDAGGSDWVCMFGKGNQSERTYGVWLEPGTNKVMYQQAGAGSDLNVYGNIPVKTGEWTHVCCVMDKNQVTVYLNGAKAGDGRRSVAPPSPASPLGIGYAMLHTSLIGAMDDVRLYRRPLAAEEVRSLFEMGK